MKRFAVTVVALLLCIAYSTSVSVEAGTKKPTVDMSNMKTIFVGWVDVDPEEFGLLNYGTKEDWVRDITRANAHFQGNLKSEFPVGRTVTMAKNRDDVNTAGNDLYIKFTDATIDKGYRLHMAIHFIDLKTNTEIASIPLDVYKASGHFCVLEGCMEIELGKVGKLIRNQVG